MSVPNQPWPGESAREWFPTHTWGMDRLPTLGQVVQGKREQGLRISVGLPTMNEAATLAPILTLIRDELGAGGAGLVDDLAIFDGGSSDNTLQVARDLGIDAYATPDLLKGVEVLPGKGEALWRSLDALRGDIVVWVDADIRNFTADFVWRLVAPLVMDPSLQFVKGYYTRPLEAGGTMIPGEGGRVTELLARPMLSSLFPELSGFIQPLSGEYAGRRDALVQVPFFTGYAVEIGLLIDLCERFGLNGLAQVDLSERIHRNRPLSDLGPMATAIARAIFKRAEQRGRIQTHLPIEGMPFLRPGTGPAAGGQSELTERLLEDPERVPFAQAEAEAGPNLG